MDAAALTAWALSHGWQLMGGHPSLVKPSNPKEAIVRLVLKATVVNLEVKKPAGKWEKVAGAAYGGVHEDEETGLPRGLGLDDDQVHSPNEKFEMRCLLGGTRSHARLLAKLAEG